MHPSETRMQVSNWIASLPVAKNVARPQSALTMYVPSASPPKAAAETDTFSWQEPAEDRLLAVTYTGEKKYADASYTGSIGSWYELAPASTRGYTIADAVQYQYNHRTSVSLIDVMNGTADFKLSMEVAPDAAARQSLIDDLRKNGIDEKDGYDYNRVGLYLNGLSENAGVSHSVDYLSAGYAVMRAHVSAATSEAEKAGFLEDLKSNFDARVEALANRAAQELGGFFAEHGVSGNISQKIHDSVINAYADKTAAYSAFFENGGDFAKLAGTQDAWLLKDDSYMAGMLRKAAHVSETSDRAYFSTDDLDGAKLMVDESGKYATSPYSSRGINDYDEQQIGLKLSELSLKNQLFQKYANVSTEMKSAVDTSIRNIVQNAVKKLNKHLEEDRRGLAEPWRLGDLRENDVFSVYNKVMSTYNATGDAVRALSAGAAFGKEEYLKRAQSDNYAFLSRYSFSPFWTNFYRNTITCTNWLTGKKEYYSASSGIEALAKSWNDFAKALTDDKTVLFSASSYMAYA